MNIFKVIASSGTTFREKFTSSILAWLLNPTMEHGLGFSFMESFVNSINKEKFLKLTSQLHPSLENNDSIENIDWMCSIELNVEKAFIDVVFTIDKWLFAIENKIYSSSATENQLKREYQGLKQDSRFKDYNICMIYLVPISGDFLDKKILSEIETLNVDKNDYKTIMTWQPNDLNYPSFSKVLSEIIQKEHSCEIEPVHEYTRHTLKAFIQFINNDFQGYESRINKTKSITPFEEKFNINELKNKTFGSVGYNDLSWIVKNKEKIKTFKFKYRKDDITDKAQWIKVNDFNKIIEWLIDGKLPEIDWSIWKDINSKNIYIISKSYKNIFVGIRGGLNGFRKLTNEEIISKRWQVSSEKLSKEWISSKDYYNEFERRKIIENNAL